MEYIETLISVRDFQNFIMNYYNSDDFEKMFENTSFFDKPYSQELRQAMRHGLIWAGLLANTSEIKQYFYKDSQD